MGAPVKGMQAAEEATAEALLGSLQSLAATERRKHATVLNYWLSIRKDRDLPPIRDLDPLEISDAGPFSVLLELIGGGEDAEIRHIGQSVKGGVDVTRMADKLEERVKSYDESRLICGFHYPTDLVAGDKVGRAVAKALLADRAFKARFDETMPEIKVAFGVK